MNLYILYIYFGGKELPKIVSLDNQDFKLLSATVVSMSNIAHFKSYFILKNKCFIVNDIGPTIDRTVPGEQAVSYCLYYNKKF